MADLPYTLPRPYLPRHAHACPNPTNEGDGLDEQCGCGHERGAHDLEGPCLVYERSGRCGCRTFTRETSGGAA